MKNLDEFRRVAPESLTATRVMAHKAAQIVSKAAAANLESREDDSHTNLGWRHDFDAFISHPLVGDGGEIFVGFNPARLALTIATATTTTGAGAGAGAAPIATLDLDGIAVDAADSWLDERLAERGLNPASKASLPHEMPVDADAIGTYSTGGRSDALAALTGWFALSASALSEFSARNVGLKPTPVRCWPHHYDIATEVNFRAPGSDEAATIGIGFSPGDDHIGEPYFYIVPWSPIDMEDLPDPAVTGHWLTEGFVGIVATATEILSLGDIRKELPEFLDRAFSLCREKMGV